MTLGGKTDGGDCANTHVAPSDKVMITATLVIRSLRMNPPVTPTFAGEADVKPVADAVRAGTLVLRTHLRCWMQSTDLVDEETAVGVGLFPSSGRMDEKKFCGNAGIFRAAA